MDRLPIFLSLQDKPCLVIGGGDVAARKIALLRRTGAAISVLAQEFNASLLQQVAAGQLTRVEQSYGSEIIRQFWLVIAATDDAAFNHRIAADAAAASRFCNVVDDNAASSFILPAIVDRSPVLIAIGTEGNAPVLAQQLKNQIEAWLPARIGALAAQAGRWRKLVQKRFSGLRERRRFWQDFFTGPIAEHLLAGRQAAAEKAMRAQLVGTVVTPATSRGEAWIVGAGPGDPGLMTLRGQNLVGRADIILYDRLVSEPILDLARKEAELIFVGKSAGSNAMSQDAINALLVRLVREGNRVCRLKGGDPFVFGRGGEEALALAAAGLPFQIVPGISAALGCAAYAGIPLTLRGVSGSVTLATAKLDSDLGPDWPQLLNAGHTLALYMGVSSIADIGEQLLHRGLPPDLPVAIVENGTTPQQRTIISSAIALARDAAAAKIVSPAMVFIGKSIRAASKLQWFEQSLADRSAVLDGGFGSHIDCARLIETG
ncbi:MAG: siroheme synthase CysG [Gammaproteobacteria bacterium]|nr:siroheme synthase CysG [Gammaproteobacteria bacterium]